MLALARERRSFSRYDPVSDTNKTVADYLSRLGQAQRDTGQTGKLLVLNNKLDGAVMSRVIRKKPPAPKDYMQTAACIMDKKQKKDPVPTPTVKGSGAGNAAPAVGLKRVAVRAWSLAAKFAVQTRRVWVGNRVVSIRPEMPYFGRCGLPTPEED